MRLGPTLFRSSVRKDLINGCMHCVSVCQCVSQSVKSLVHAFLSRLNLVQEVICAACEVRRPPSMFFLSGAYLGNRTTYLDDI